jgi:hypothetical protein
LVEHRENIFAYLPQVEYVADWQQALKALTPIKKAA